MWRRRNAVEHALRVANDLYAEAEAAAMAAYTRAKGGGVPHSWWKEQGSAQRPALTPAQREEVCMHVQLWHLARYLASDTDDKCACSSLA